PDHGDLLSPLDPRVPPTKLPPRLHAKNPAGRRHQHRFSAPADNSIPAQSHILSREPPILDSPRPSQYGPPASKAAVKSRSSRVSTAWPTRTGPTTRATRLVVSNHPPKRPRSPRGCVISANGWASTIPTVLPTVRRVRPPTLRRSLAVFGCQPSSSQESWSAPASAGCSIAGSDLRPSG